MAKAKFAKGNMVVFKGYSEDVAEDEQFLTEGETYEVADVNAAEKTLGIEIENPDFNPKKKESDTNSKTLMVDVFFDEVEMAEDAEGEEEEEEAPKAKAKPASKTAAKPAAKAKAKAKDEEEEEETEGEGDDEEEEEEAPAPKSKAAAKAKPAAKGKAKAETKGKGKAAAKPKKEEPEEKDESEALPPLENEDEDIVELVNGADDIVALAAELVEDSAALDYKLGGVLYHTRLGKAYQEVDAKYAEKGGWQLFIDEQLPGLGYRKAMHLIDIYYKFNLFGIDAAKVQELGWTKCSKIAQVMTEENAEELVELAESSSVAELNDTIKESYKEVGGTAGDKRRKVAFKFRLWEDQAAGVQDTIAAVQEAMGFKDPSDAFEHIVMEWAAEHPVEKKAKAKVAAKTEAKAAAPAGKAKVRAKA